MVIYRPNTGGLQESMELAKEFENFDAMKEYIVEQKSKMAPEWGAPFSVDDIVISEESVDDKRIGWKDTRYVCVKRYYNEDYMAKYGSPQCIGMCATDYGSIEQSKRMCKEFLEEK